MHVASRMFHFAHPTPTLHRASRMAFIVRCMLHTPCIAATRVQAVKFCVLITDGVPQENYLTREMSSFCTNRGIAQSDCTMRNVMYAVKAAGYIVFGVFVGTRGADASMLAQGRATMSAYSSCEVPVCPVTCGQCTPDAGDVAYVPPIHAAGSRRQVMVQVWEICAESRCRCGRGEPIHAAGSRLHAGLASRQFGMKRASVSSFVVSALCPSSPSSETCRATSTRAVVPTSSISQARQASSIQKAARCSSHGSSTAMRRRPTAPVGSRSGATATTSSSGFQLPVPSPRARHRWVTLRRRM